jgi:hypothetical protein
MQSDGGFGNFPAIIFPIFIVMNSKPMTFTVVLGLLLFSCTTRDSEMRADWLIDPSAYQAKLEKHGSDRVSLTNGLVSRTFLLAPNAATIGFDNLETGQSMLRGVKPEAEITLNGKAYPIGGLTGQPNYAYLTEEWISRLVPIPGSMVFVDYQLDSISERISWKRVRHASPDVNWPPKGLHLRMNYRMPAGEAADIRVVVHYEIYDGIPLFSKWISLENRSSQPVNLNSFKSEILAFVEKESPVEERGIPLKKPDLFVETEYEFSGMETLNTTLHSVFWMADPDFTTQVNYLLLTPCLLEVRPEIGPNLLIGQGESFESFRAWELVPDGNNEERRLLAQRKMYRVIAPWVTENPLMMHIRNSDPVSVKAAIDQCAAVGFEMGIITFGSGFNMESTDTAYQNQWKELAAYAHSRGVELGGYSLLSSRSISETDDVVNPATGKTGGVIHGNAPCLGSNWGKEYMEKLYNWFSVTGMNLLEHDGSYPGHICASMLHPYHRGTDDSQWVQWRIITDFYKWCRAEGVYLNIPDWYYLNGGSKCAMGYREVNWSLPREQQVIHARQNIFDGTREKTPSMGWMFVPLTEYHGGGAAATIEPLKEHLDHYSKMLASNLGNGVQACYRGPRLFDADTTQRLVKSWVDFYKEHRDILESDIIHTSSRRADGRGLDWMFHANPNTREKGFLMIFNPTAEKIRRDIRINVYYTGLKENVRVENQHGDVQNIRMNRDYFIAIPVEVPAGEEVWYVLK